MKSKQIMIGGLMAVVGICGLSAVAEVPNADYLRLDYIESTKQQYIDTGMRGYEPFSSEFDMLWVAFDSGETFFGGYTSGGQGFHPIRFSNEYLWLKHGSQDNAEMGLAVRTFKRYIVKTTFQNDAGGRLKKTELFYKGAENQRVNVSQKDNGSFSAANGCQRLLIFGYSDSEVKTFTPAGHNRVYRAKMSSGNGSEKRDFVAALKLSDNTSGLLDVLTGTFYPSATGVDFIHGPTAESIGAEYLYTDGTLSGIELKFAEEAFVRELYVVYGDTDGGDAPGDWTSSVKVADVAASATSAQYALPAGFGQAGCRILRFILTNGTYLEWSKSIASDDALAPVYERLEYIESANTANINTGLFAYDPFVGEIDMEYTRLKNDENIAMGSVLGGTSRWYPIRLNPAGTALMMRHGSQDTGATATFMPKASTRYDVRINFLPGASAAQKKAVEFYPHGIAHMAGDTVKNNGRITKSTYKIGLFGFMDANVNPRAHAYMRVYRAHLANEGWSDQNPQLERRDFIPVKNLANGKAGLYDISGASGASPFYPSTTSADFTYANTTFAAIGVSATGNQATLSFDPLDHAKTLWMVFGDEDRGTDAAAWSAKVKIADLAAGSCGRVCPLPANWGGEGCKVVKFCLLDENGVADWSKTVDIDSTEPVVATWIGAGEAGNPLDPENWLCRNAAGVQLPATTLPTAVTECTVAGAQSFAVPSGSALVYKTLAFDNFTPPADCDLRGLREPFSGTIDLKGVSLTVATLSQLSEVTDSSTETVGKLNIEVPAGVTMDNYMTKLSGRLQLVKTGAGTYICTCYGWGQTYTGGNRIVEGTVKAHAGGGYTYAFIGSTYSTFGLKSATPGFTVEAGGTLDENRELGLRTHSTVLAGGRIVNNREDYANADDGGIGNLTLTADSLIEFGMKILCTGPASNLGGHTLEFKWGASSKTVYNRNGVAYSNGTIKLNRNGKDPAWFTMDGGNTGTIYDWRTVDFDVNAGFALERGLRIHDYVCRYDGATPAYHTNRGLFVYGTFKPVTDKFVGFQLQNGGAIDLSEKTGTWSTKTANGIDTQRGLESGLATFADNGTFTIKLGERDLAGELHAQGGDTLRLISWETAPSNLDGLEFVQEPDSPFAKKWRLVKSADGVSIVREHGTVIIVR